MIITTREVRSKSNFTGTDSVKMSIDPEGMAHIARIVTDLYADPESACLREYAANGLDSHVEAGQTRPIEVTLPTNERPNLLFQDWGTGMSKADITNIYSKYGASTKRKSNKLIGALGLGCKSALSMSPSFTLTSVKDGKKVVAIIHRGEDGVGNIEFAMEIETTDPNGVIVSIPVSENIREYESKAKAIFITWARGTVLVNGKEPALSISTDADFMKLGKAGYISRQGVQLGRVPSYIRNGSMVVNMGGIGYPVEGKQMETLLNGIKEDQFPKNMRNALASIKSAIRSNLTLVVNVGLGDVDLVPSRESVRWTRKSTDAVSVKIKDALLAIPDALAEDFKDCKTHLDVLSKNVLSFAESFRAIYRQVEWNGKKLPSNIPLYLTTQDNYYDESIENFVMRYNSQGERIPALKSDSTEYFSFGFETSHPRSFSTGTNTVNTAWVFVKVDDAEDVRKRVSAYANSFVEDLKENGDVAAVDSVRIVAHQEDIFQNEWLAAIFNASNKFMQVDLADVATRAKSRRRINAAAGASGRGKGGSTERVSLTYKTLIIDKNGVENYQHLTTKAIDEYVAQNKSNFYIDNNDYLRYDGYNGRWERLNVFAPSNSVIVSVGQGRKVEALQKRLSSIPGNLTADINKGMNEFVKSVTIEDYFDANSPHALLSDTGLAEYLEDGFMKRVLTGSPANGAKLRAVNYMGKDYLTTANKDWAKKFEAARAELVSQCVLVFGARREYNVNKDLYSKALGVYLNGLKDEIEAIVSKTK